MYDGHLVVYKQLLDVTLYVIGGMEENEIMLYQVVVAFRDALDSLLRYIAKWVNPCRQSPDKRTLLDNYDVVTLVADEIIDDG